MEGGEGEDREKEIDNSKDLLMEGHTNILYVQFTNTSRIKKNIKNVTRCRDSRSATTR